ncbi:NEDD4-binding protein 1 [Latimeria chalumnae]|uniref:NEDD4-binding protein 1 n=1 Tax=Latimeria chalumnae TaxID=7897 RepID=UPI0003C1908B|nr:PREDICTED: NEDD4-binding protein 1 [Latimeria chalumnae]|eukprot:XP_005998415.1 PREDICTED: NEDD4-binding protein 1 [Latimeria chalumnae]
MATCVGWRKNSAAELRGAGGRGSSGRREAVVDEFTAPEGKRPLLEGSAARVEALFRVTLSLLSALDLFPIGRAAGRERGGGPPERIWLQLKGAKEDVPKAKEYIKGLCEPELEEKEYYPKDMHCIFVGAQNLFLNGLIQHTCADVSVLELGVLGIKGGTEAVVMARSRIQQFLKLFQNNQSLPSTKESSVKKQFKTFVEAHADKFTMDLLLLPSSVKEELLSLTQDPSIIDLTESDGCDLVPSVAQNRNHISDLSCTEADLSLEESRNKAGTPVTELVKQIDTVFSNSSSQQSDAALERQSYKRRSSGSEDRLAKRQYSLENSQSVAPGSSENVPADSSTIETSSDSASKPIDSCLLDDNLALSSEKEYIILVNFFKTMGYSQETVESVINRMGQSEEPLVLLEEIEQESKKLQGGPKISVSQTTTNKPCKERSRFDRAGSSELSCYNNKGNGSKVDNKSKENKQKITSTQLPCDQSEDEMRGPVIALTPKQVKSVALPFPGHQNDLVVLDDIEMNGPKAPFCNVQVPAKEKVTLKDSDFVARGSAELPKHKPVRVESETLQQQSAQSSSHFNAAPSPRENPGSSKPGYSQYSDHQSDKKTLQLHQGVPQSSRLQMVRPSSQLYDPMVTGVQRFLNSLKVPYKLNLRNEPGRDDLNHIIIDGSNVAMTHGLHRFFSCRGIAIAVEYFWNCGHRNITVFVPQWRAKSDPAHKEQQFLTELNELGVLSFTPSRTVCGTRIASHDDRFLLHLAEKTGGIIVTNDNFKEFTEESPAWMDIIKRRLLQYTFVGDIFMIPDDPLGRHGPRIEDFLRKGVRVFPMDSSRERVTGFPPAVPNHIMPTFGNQGPNAWVSPTRPPLNWIQQNRPADPFPPNDRQLRSYAPPQRSASETEQVKQKLLGIFPEFQQRQKIEQILSAHPYMRDLNALSAMVLD